MVIIDIDGKSKYRIINVYRIFNPMNEVTEKLYFERQVELIRRAVKSKPVIHDIQSKMQRVTTLMTSSSPRSPKLELKG